MDPDREALRAAIKWAGHIGSATKHGDIILEAARRDLARLEGEKPKKASLGELIAYVGEAECAMGAGDMDEQVAAVLRAVGDYRDGKISPAEFLRSLP